MSIKWNGTLAFVGVRCVASIHKSDKGWFAVHHSWVNRHLNPTYTPCKTEAGIKRRVAQYVHTWIVAGKPDGDDL